MQAAVDAWMEGRGQRRRIQALVEEDLRPRSQQGAARALGGGGDTEKVYSLIAFACGAHPSAHRLIVPDDAWKRVRVNSKRWRRAKGGGMVAYGAALLSLRLEGRVHGNLNVAVGEAAAGDLDFWGECIAAGQEEGWIGAVPDAASDLTRPVFAAWSGVSIPHLCRFIEHPEAALLVQTFVIDALREGRVAGSHGYSMQGLWQLSLWSRCKTGDLWRKDSMGMQSGFRWLGPGKCRLVTHTCQGGEGGESLHV